jgi:hypothetical protein
MSLSELGKGILSGASLLMFKAVEKKTGAKYLTNLLGKLCVS